MSMDYRRESICSVLAGASESACPVADRCARPRGPTRRSASAPARWTLAAVRAALAGPAPAAEPLSRWSTRRSSRCTTARCSTPAAVRRVQNYLEHPQRPAFWEAARFTVIFTVVRRLRHLDRRARRWRCCCARTSRAAACSRCCCCCPGSCRSWSRRRRGTGSSRRRRARSRDLPSARPRQRAVPGEPALAQVVVCMFKVWISFPFMMMMMSLGARVGRHQRLRGREDRRRDRLADVPLHHAADHLPHDVHQLDPDDDLLRQRLPDDLPADRRRSGQRDDHRSSCSPTARSSRTSRPVRASRSRS